jgi:hypothetical protein
MAHVLNKKLCKIMLVLVTGFLLAAVMGRWSLVGPVPSLNTNVALAAQSDPCKDTTNATGNITQTNVQKCITQTPIVHDLQTIVNMLSAGVAIIVTGVILLGGIQYIMAGGNASALTAARQRILNGVIALFAFLFMFAFLQWLIPGGVFHK